jgi:hypothetical protein
MSFACTVGKRELQGDEVLSLLSGHNFWPQLMAAMVVDRALRSIRCSATAIDDYYGAELAADSAFFEKKRAQLIREGVREEDIDFYISRPVLLALFKEQRFVPLVGSAFLKLKAGLDSVLFSMLRNKDHELTRELFFRLESGEESFDSLAPRYAEGREAVSGGRLGPMEMRQLHPILARVLSTAQPGVVNPPVVIDGFGVITLLHEKIAAKLDESMEQHLVDHLYNEWVKGEVQEFFY